MKKTILSILVMFFAVSIYANEGFRCRAKVLKNPQIQDGKIAELTASGQYFVAAGDYLDGLKDLYEITFEGRKLEIAYDLTGENVYFVVTWKRNNKVLSMISIPTSINKIKEGTLVQTIFPIPHSKKVGYLQCEKKDF